MENKNWVVFKKDMVIRAPIYCASMVHDYEGLLTITYKNNYHGDGEVKKAQVTVCFDSERVFATRKRSIMNCDKIVCNIDTSKGWVFYTKESEFIDSFKKDFLYDDDCNDYTHYIFISDSEMIDVISTCPPVDIEELVGVENKED